jgi:Domain of unknown function (DUF4258)
MKLSYLRQALHEDRFEISSHALDMMIERKIGLSDIRNAVERGRALEVKPKAKPFPTTWYLDRWRFQETTYTLCFQNHLLETR